MLGFLLLIVVPVAVVCWLGRGELSRRRRDGGGVV
jgi:hypothetical protein